MKKFLIGFIVIIVLAGITLFVLYKNMISETKKFSPEDTVVLEQGDLKLSVFYNRPSKKGREIFGGLVPYGKVWRTGANEATTFETNKDLLIDGKTLKAGKYSLFTVPDKDNWQVIFNDRSYNWGIKRSGEASIDRNRDVLTAFINIEYTDEVAELFTISFESSPEIAMILTWDTTKIRVPIKQ